MTNIESTAEIDAIDEQRQGWIKSLNSADANGFSGCCTDDVLWLPPDGNQFEGRQALHEWLVGPFEIYDFNYSQSNLKIRLTNSGTRAIEESHFVSQVKEKGTKKWQTHEGECLIIWHKSESGQWAIELYVDRGAPYAELEP